MLIDKGVSIGEVITLKLTSGEELVAKLTEEKDSYYKLSRPMVIAMGAKGPGLMPYLFTVHPDKEVKILCQQYLELETVYQLIMVVTDLLLWRLVQEMLL